MFFRKTSLRKYPNLSIPVGNPLDLKKIPRGKTYQVTHHHFILQFYINKQDIYGIVFKRDRRFPLRVRWCFYRSCEESPFDYTITIAESFNPPFEENFFRIKFPFKLQYEFQGLEFTAK